MREEKRVETTFYVPITIFLGKKRNPEDLEGEWLSAERLPPGYLTSAHGDTIALDDYAFIPSAPYRTILKAVPIYKTYKTKTYGKLTDWFNFCN